MNTLMVKKNSLIFEGFEELTSSVVFVFFFSSGIEITSQDRNDTTVPVLRLVLDDSREAILDGIEELLKIHGVTNNSNFVYLKGAYCRIP